MKFLISSKTFFSSCNKIMSCLFRALGKHTGESDDVVRSKIVNFLATNPKLLGEISANDAMLWETGQTSTNYIQSMRQASTWGGALEISAFSKLYGLNVFVEVPQRDNTKIIRFFNIDAKTAIGLTWNGSHFEPLK